MTGREQETWRAYSELWRVLGVWFRVPETPPTLPAVAGETPDAFKPAPGFVGYLKLWFWIASILIDLLILIGWIAVTIAVWWLGLLLVVPALVLAVVPDILAYVAIHLRYDTTWCVMTDRSLRIRRGIWVIHEMTFTFENVQNVKVQQGPMQRVFGLSDLIVETAGSGSDPHGKSGPALNRGIVEGVADAGALRDRVLARVKASRSAGFGDEEDIAGTGAGKMGPRWKAEHVEVLREIRDELRLGV